MRFGPWEITFIIVIILIIFGAGKLPQVGSAIGRSVQAFKKPRSGEDEEKKKEPAAAPKASPDNKNGNSHG